MSVEKTSAQLCRENGWGAGTVLEGEWDPKCGIEPVADRIRITAIGEKAVLAIKIGYRKDGVWHERNTWEEDWELTERDWKAVAAEPAAGGEELRGLTEAEMREENSRLTAELEAFYKVLAFWCHDEEGESEEDICWHAITEIELDEGYSRVDTQGPFDTEAEARAEVRRAFQKAASLEARS